MTEADELMSTIGQEIDIETEEPRGASGASKKQNPDVRERKYLQRGHSPDAMAKAADALLHMRIGYNDIQNDYREPARSRNMPNKANCENRHLPRASFENRHSQRNRNVSNNCDRGYSPQYSRSNNDNSHEYWDHNYNQMLFDSDHDFNRNNFRRPKVMPDSFDGKGSWPQYLAHFETVGDLNGWNLREKAQYLSVSLRGEACQIIQFLPYHERRNYVELIKALNKRFDPGHTASLHRVQLRTRSRKDRESIPQLAQSIRSLAAQAYPTADNWLFDSLCCDHFVDALQDDELKMRLISADAQKFDDVVSYALKYEACNQARKLKHPNKKFVREIDVMSNDCTPQVTENETTDARHCNAMQSQKENKYQSDGKNAQINKIQEQIDSLTKLVKELAENNRKSYPPRQNNGKIKCFHCGQEGHKRPDCPKLGKVEKEKSETPKSN